jgi:O-acetyl-ADP-ribose deacetylase (regulator of RNase III)
MSPSRNPFKKKKSTSRTKITCVAGNIVTIGTDVIVNAANSKLREGAGVCGAIFKAAGSTELQKACDQHGHCPTGSAVITQSFRISQHGTKHIVHAVGPIYSANNATECDGQLVGAYRSALKLAESVGARSIAIPAISTGIFGFPEKRAAQLVAELLTTETFNLDEIVLMALEDSKVKTYADALASA